MSGSTMESVNQKLGKVPPELNSLHDILIIIDNDNRPIISTH